MSDGFTQCAPANDIGRSPLHPFRDNFGENPRGQKYSDAATEHEQPLDGVPEIFNDLNLHLENS